MANEKKMLYKFNFIREYRDMMNDDMLTSFWRNKYSPEDIKQMRELFDRERKRRNYASPVLSESCGDTSA